MLPAKPPLRYLLSEDGTQRLVQLDFIEESVEGWQYYAVTFLGISEEQWLTAMDADPRDVRYVFERTDGQRVPFASLGLMPDRERRELRVKGEGYFATSPPRRSFRDWLLGRPKPRVAQERAPRGWERVKRRHVLRDYASGDEVRMTSALGRGADFSRREDLDWLLPLLLDGVRRAEMIVRLMACTSLGEIARLHGYSDERVLQALQDAIHDPEYGVRKAAAESLDEVRRFATPADAPRSGTPHAQGST